MVPCQLVEVTAALSAAVDSHNEQGIAPHLTGVTKQKEKRTSSASRSSGKRGLGERNFSQRSRLPPRIPRYFSPIALSSSPLGS